MSVSSWFKKTSSVLCAQRCRIRTIIGSRSPFIILVSAETNEDQETTQATARNAISTTITIATVAKLTWSRTVFTIQMYRTLPSKQKQGTRFAESPAILRFRFKLLIKRIIATSAIKTYKWRFPLFRKTNKQEMQCSESNITSSI